MRITKIKAEQLAVPLLHPYVLSKEYGVYSVATPVVVTIFTDEGIVGYGECVRIIGSTYLNNRHYTGCARVGSHRIMVAT